MLRNLALWGNQNKSVRGDINMKSYWTVILLVIVLTGEFADTAYAYLDAGSGSMILQLLLGGVAGLIVFLKVSWKWILEKFGIKKEENVG
ncbi:MAG: hypothetical protein P8Z30_12925 [Acidobacteriota bacterium]